MALHSYPKSQPRQASRNQVSRSVPPHRHHDLPLRRILPPVEDDEFDIKVFLAEVASLTPEERERLIRSYAP